MLTFSEMFKMDNMLECQYLQHLLSTSCRYFSAGSPVISLEDHCGRQSANIAINLPEHLLQMCLLVKDAALFFSPDLYVGFHLLSDKDEFKLMCLIISSVIKKPHLPIRHHCTVIETKVELVAVQSQLGSHYKMWTWWGYWCHDKSN